MVSTRGIKSKFTEGELVLCYEPDPAKTKVLYDSKVLEIIVNKDETGKKFLEFLIHFQGWNPTWDRFVTEDYVLKDTAENRQLQKELAEKAQLTTAVKLYRGGNLYKRDRKKRTRKLSEKINESLEAKRPLVSPETETTTQDDDTSESSAGEEDCPLTVTIPISDGLKRLLEHDYHLVSLSNRLLKLPTKPNVLTILEGYVKDYALNQLSPNVQQENEKSSRASTSQKSLDSVCNALNICKEVADGLRVYFDFTLKDLLLYLIEKDQYAQFFANVKQEPCNDSQPASSVHVKQEAMSDSDSIPVTVTNLSVHSDKEAPGSTCTEGDRRKSLRSHRAAGFEFTNGVVGKSSIVLPESKDENINSVPNSNSANSASPVPVNNARKREALLSQIMAWKIVPPHVIKKSPLVPSQVYGAVHLTRLFVKLPELMPNSMPGDKLELLLDHFQGLLKYLEAHPEWFDESHYQDSVATTTASADEVSN